MPDNNGLARGFRTSYWLETCLLMYDCEGREKGWNSSNTRKAFKYNELRALGEFLRREGDKFRTFL